MPEETSPVPLDEVLYERFKELGAMQGYEYLDGDKNAREAQKRLFLSGEVQNPQLDYPKIDTQLLGISGSPTGANPYGESRA